MKFGIDRLIAEPALRAPLSGRRVALARASRFGHGRPDALARCAGRLRRHQDHRRVRSAARPARRQAGQHDRVAGLQRSGARHPGVQPVWRGAQADRCDDGHVRCHPRRSAGSGLPHLYVHHDAALRARSGGATRQGGVGAGSAQSGRPAGRRPDAARRLGKLCRRRTVADAPRADARRAGSRGSSKRSSSMSSIASSRCRAGSPMPRRDSAGRSASAPGSIPVPTRRICGWRAPMRAR